MTNKINQDYDWYNLKDTIFEKITESTTSYITQKIKICDLINKINTKDIEFIFQIKEKVKNLAHNHSLIANIKDYNLKKYKKELTNINKKKLADKKFIEIFPKNALVHITCYRNFHKIIQDGYIKPRCLEGSIGFFQNTNEFTAKEGVGISLFDLSLLDYNLERHADRFKEQCIKPWSGGEEDCEIKIAFCINRDLLESDNFWDPKKLKDKYYNLWTCEYNINGGQLIPDNEVGYTKPIKLDSIQFIGIIDKYRKKYQKIVNFRNLPLVEKHALKLKRIASKNYIKSFKFSA